MKRGAESRIPEDALDHVLRPTTRNSVPTQSPPQVPVAAPPAPAATSGRRETPLAELGPRDYTSGGRPPALDLLAEEPVRVGLYFRPSQVKALRQEVKRRQRGGHRCDLSALVRELVDAGLQQLR